MKWKYNKRTAVIAITSLMLGFFVIVQWRSFGLLQAQHRDVHKNIFREIQILKETNQNLKNEIEELNQTRTETSNQALALQSIESEITKYKILSGESDIEGPGIIITINSDIDALWLVDLVNELFNAGAEAISINDLRLTDLTQGFEILPQGQVFFHINTLEKPYIFKTIGEPSELSNVILQKGGIYERMKSKYPTLNLEVSTQERIEMKKI